MAEPLSENNIFWTVLHDCIYDTPLLRRPVHRILFLGWPYFVSYTSSSNFLSITIYLAGEGLLRTRISSYFLISCFFIDSTFAKHTPVIKLVTGNTTSASKTQETCIQVSQAERGRSCQKKKWMK